MRFMALLKFDESLPGGPPPPALFQAMGEYAAGGRPKWHPGRPGRPAAERRGSHRVAG